MTRRLRFADAVQISRAVLLCVACTLALPEPTAAQQADARSNESERNRQLVQEIITYLEDIGSLSGRYSQVSTDGRRASGVFEFEFPSKMHFAELTPTRNRLISDGSWIASIEEETGKAVRYPISSTPFAALLSTGLSDSDEYDIVEVQSQPDGDRSRHFLSISLKDEEALGVLTLLFLDPPLEFEGWIIRDAQNQATLVRLETEHTNRQIDPNRFRIHMFER